MQPEACVPVAHDFRVHADLAARREVHEQDATARGIHLLAPEQIGRTRRQAETAVHAVGDQRRIGRVMIVEGERFARHREDAPGSRGGPALTAATSDAASLASGTQGPRGIELPLDRAHEVERDSVIHHAGRGAHRRG